jgi:hypothetical protein
MIKRTEKVFKSDSGPECARDLNNYGDRKQEGGREIDAILANESYEENPREEIDGYILDKDLSKKSGKILTYHNPETNDVIIAHRGTADLNDVKNDLYGVVFGQLDKTKRYQNAKEITEKAIDKYKDANINHSGHSLGASFADRLAGEYKNDVYLYNPGTSPISAANAYKRTKKTRELNTTLIDPVSINSIWNPRGLKLHFPKSINTHSMSNFL